MTLIDTHAHLTDDRLRSQIAAVLDRAQRAGVERIVCVATSADDSAASIALGRQFPAMIAPSVGIHPNHAAQAQPGDWDQVVAMADDPSVVAIGETGLDRHWNDTPFAMQEDFFARHLGLSRTTKKPIVIHCREAEADVIRMLRAEFERHGPIRGVMHSFCGAWATAEAALEMGLHISYAGMLTYKNGDNVRDTAVRVSADRLLVETDCPYLAPMPMRGKTNEPAFVAHTAVELARIRGIPPDLLADLTSENARRLFFSRG
jgi:TatD DNase family protein